MNDKDNISDIYLGDVFPCDLRCGDYWNEDFRSPNPSPYAKRIATIFEIKNHKSIPTAHVISFKFEGTVLSTEQTFYGNSPLKGIWRPAPWEQIEMSIVVARKEIREWLVSSNQKNLCPGET